MYKWGILHCSPVFANRSKAIEAKRSIVLLNGAVGKGMIDEGEETKPTHTPPQHTPTFTPKG